MIKKVVFVTRKEYPIRKSHTLRILFCTLLVGSSLPAAWGAPDLAYRLKAEQVVGYEIEITADCGSYMHTMKGNSIYTG